MSYDAKDLGKLIRDTRKALKITQAKLALTSGTGIRFIIELEKGKPTCQLDKVLTVLNRLGVEITFKVPHTETEND